MMIYHGGCGMLRRNDGLSYDDKLKSRPRRVQVDTATCYYSTERYLVSVQ